jgi:hypothetical protein
MKIELKIQLQDRCQELHKLIRSLTRGQHNGLRRRLSPKRQKLYDLYHKMEDYDQRLIKEEFHDYSHGTLHALRTHLMDEVIRYIVDFTQHDGRRDLYQLLTEGKHLRAADMHTLAINRLHNAIHLAMEMEAMPELVEAVHETQTLVGLAGASPSEVDELMRVEAWAIMGVEESTQINRLHAALFRIGRLPLAEGFAELDVLEKEIRQLAYPKLIRNQIKYLLIKHSIFKKCSQIVPAMDTSRDIIRISEEYPNVLADASIRDLYFRAITFLAVAHADLKEFELSEVYLARLKTLAKHWGGGLEENPSLLARYTYSSIVGKIGRKDWKAAHDIAKKIFVDVVQKGLLNHVALKSSLVWISALAAFLYRDFRLSRLLLKDLKSGISLSGAMKNRPMWIAGISAVHLLSYVEEGDAHLRVAIRDTTKWIHSHNSLDSYNVAILKFLKAVCEDAECKPSAPSLMTLQQELKTLFLNPIYKEYQFMFPILPWIEAKLSGKDLSMVEFD